MKVDTNLTIFKAIIARLMNYGISKERAEEFVRQIIEIYREDILPNE